MMKFKGIYFDGKSSLPRDVTIFFDGVLVHIEGTDIPKGYTVAISDCIIHPAIGKTNRTLKLPDGAICETDDLLSFQTLEKQTEVNRTWRFIHFLESHWKAVALCALCLILFTAAFVRYGIPFLAGQIASRVPPEMMQSISNKALKFLDTQFLQPSELSTEKRLEMTKVFQQTSREMSPETRCILEFRKGKRIGANAFALPSGIVVITDELVSISQNDQEIAGIFAHEITHIRKNHAMRHLLQSTGAFFLVSFLVGDIASITSIAATLPTLLVESGYSREFEREADKEAGLYMIRKGWSTKPFQNILNNLATSHSDSPDLGIFSSHPKTMMRIKALQEFEAIAEKPSK